jgi:hypothetical protein
MSEEKGTSFTCGLGPLRGFAGRRRPASC